MGDPKTLILHTYNTISFFNGVHTKTLSMSRKNYIYYIYINNKIICSPLLPHALQNWPTSTTILSLPEPFYTAQEKTDISFLSYLERERVVRG